MQGMCGHLLPEDELEVFAVMLGRVGFCIFVLQLIAFLLPIFFLFEFLEGAG
jgi:hypothetical protein